MIATQPLTRRRFVQLSSAALVSTSILSDRSLATPISGPANLRYSLDQNWQLYGNTSRSNGGYNLVTLPHVVVPLSWKDWDAHTWEQRWSYRRLFTVPQSFAGHRVFLRFDAVSVAASPIFNGQALATHLGGYLPFSYEVTSKIKPGGNTLDMHIDATWQDIPPDGNPKGFASVDYFEPAGIIRSTYLEALPQVFLSDVFAQPVDILKPTRRIELLCTIDVAQAAPGHYEIQAELIDDTHSISTTRAPLNLTPNSKTEAILTLSNVSNCKLWGIDTPHLYTVVTTLLLNGIPVHDYRTRIGFREASFTVDGFFLNGRKLQLFGLNRHEIYPYTGFAMPPRVLRKDAEILKHDLNCNIVRCSHYPQSEAFLDACDELGIMVWQEPPGWQWLSEEKPYQDVVCDNVRDMILRDRNHASVVIWGVRINESRTDVALYARTTAIAKDLDPSRPTSGSMTSLEPYEKDWKEDVFSMDDYHNAPGPTGGVAIYPPLDGVPYMISETVGQKSYDGQKGFSSFYYRGNDPKTLALQAIYHAQAHDRADAYSRMNGVIAWCAFEYPSPQNSHHGVKNPGVYDHFRLPKLGASFYLAQCDPRLKPIIAPNFYWDFGPTQPTGPGKQASIFSNCDRLEIFVNDKHLITATPDRSGYPHTRFPPCFVDLDIDTPSHPELRIDGYLGKTKVLTHPMSSNPELDQFLVTLSDQEILADGADATRIAFKVADKFGNDRLDAVGSVAVTIDGPGTLVGDSPFDLTAASGVGAVWIKSQPNKTGRIHVTVTHDTLGSESVVIKVVQDTTSHIA